MIFQYLLAQGQCICKAYLRPLAEGPIRTRRVVTCLRDGSLVLAALALCQSATQVIHAVGVTCTGASPTALRTLRAQFSHHSHKQQPQPCVSYYNIVQVVLSINK